MQFYCETFLPWKSRLENHHYLEKYSLDNQDFYDVAMPFFLAVITYNLNLKATHRAQLGKFEMWAQVYILVIGRMS